MSDQTPGREDAQETSPQMDCRAVACLAWSRDGRLVSRISLGRGLVDWICSVLEKVIPPLGHAGRKPASLSFVAP
jgi:hypothetical protein